MKRIVLITGGFDPIHSGHIEYIKEAKKLGDILIVGVNSDSWLVKKKGKAFLPLKERLSILESIKGVDFAIGFDDSDGSARQAINMVRLSYPQDHIIFANGGDRNERNVPEKDVNDENLEFAFGVGGTNKKNSSSWILHDWKTDAEKVYRPWGYYKVLYEIPGLKVKELTVDPGKALSKQRHLNRSEYWIVGEGTGTVYHGDNPLGSFINKHQQTTIEKRSWHRLMNEFSTPLKIIEIQYGISCTEDDIERKDP
jgi:cytidyltransferase-like protein